MNDIKIIYPEVFKYSGKIQMSQKGQPIGYSNLIRQGNVVTLCDIYIYDHSCRICRFLPWLKIGKNYRGLGYANDLLTKTIDFCKKHRIEEIKGKAEGDLTILVPWYKKHGFTVGNNNEIHLKLNV